jgi:hypothetical protein
MTEFVGAHEGIPLSEGRSIERVEVEGGFLDRLDLHLVSGLNVVIGPRGAGKTSIIELIRFCLGVDAFTDAFAQSAREHALSVLGSGRVTVTVQTDGDRYTVSRAADDEVPAVAGIAQAEKPIILSQREIEAVGLDSQGRLRVIDGFRSSSSNLDTKEKSVLSLVRSLTAELREINAEIATLRSAEEELTGVKEALAGAEAEAQEKQKSVVAAADDMKALDELGRTLAAASVRRSVYERVRQTLQRWRDQAEMLSLSPPSVEEWPDAAETGDPLDDVRRQIEMATTRIDEGIAATDEGIATVEDLDAKEAKAVQANEERARTLRRRAEELQEGAGAAARRLGQLRERVSQLSALHDLATQKRARADETRARRRQALDELDDIREKRFEERMAVAEALNSEFGPRLNVRILRSGLQTEYASAISSALRGSGLHYSKLAPFLAGSLTPRELCEAVETEDVAAIASAGQIPEDRAQRVIGQLRESGTGEILAAPIQDGVSLELLDGGDYKNTTQMSTGQRCTVILPILLHHVERSVIVDQPEDHLDNAFIVDTLIRGIRSRPPIAQLIVSTHNPNIPVLGEAGQVIVLASDGKRGFVRVLGELEDPEVVSSITSLMEGGREAFARRARFYGASVESGVDGPQ